MRSPLFVFLSRQFERPHERHEEGSSLLVPRFVSVRERQRGLPFTTPNGGPQLNRRGEDSTMTYEEFSNLLWEKQSLKLKWRKHEIQVMRSNGYVYVKGPAGHCIETFSSLSEALDKWWIKEERDSLATIVTETTLNNCVRDTEFAENAILDPKLFTGPTKLHRDSISFGRSVDSNFPEQDCISMFENICSCLYDVLPGERIYRTLEFWQLGQMLDRKSPKIHFSDPCIYHDSCESFIIGDSGEMSRKGFLWGVSCWSSREESEGIWNNYVRGSRQTNDNKSEQHPPSNQINTSEEHPVKKERPEYEKQRVKIETTAEELLAAIIDSFDKPEVWKRCRLGRVRYHDEFYIRAFKNRVDALRKEGRTCEASVYASLQSLFMKRCQYDYEQEIRLVLHCQHDMKMSEKGVYLSLKRAPQTLIHEVVVNPDCSDENFKKIKLKLKRLGIDRVIKSNLSKAFPQD